MLRIFLWVQASYAAWMTRKQGCGIYARTPVFGLFRDMLRKVSELKDTIKALPAVILLIS